MSASFAYSRPIRFPIQKKPALKWHPILEYSCRVGAPAGNFLDVMDWVVAHRQTCCSKSEEDSDPTVRITVHTLPNPKRKLPVSKSLRVFL